MLSLPRRLLAILATSCFAACLSGCCGSMGCGPRGCGPILLGHHGDGCGKCEGCGELYLDPWINHPPDCCDPCDSCGNHNGQSCGSCRPVMSGIRTLWGYRYDHGCHACDHASPGHRASCGHDVTCGHDVSCGHESSCGLESFPGSGYREVPMPPVSDVEDRGVRLHADPKPAKPINPARPELRPYPQDTQRIFKARPAPEVASGPVRIH